MLLNINKKWELNKIEAIFADTNALIKLLGGDIIVAELLNGKTVFISEMTEMELLCKPNASKEDKKAIQILLEDCVIIPFNQEIKHRAIKIRLSTRMKLIDSIVGASAVNVGLSIVTNDGDFTRLSNEIDIILIP